MVPRYIKDELKVVGALSERVIGSVSAVEVPVHLFGI